MARVAHKRRPIKIAKSHKGLLHKKLGVKLGTKIPLAKLHKAAKSKSLKLKREALFALNFGHRKKA